MTQKGVCPCGYMNSFEKFEQNQLPTKEQFYTN